MTGMHCIVMEPYVETKGKNPLASFSFPVAELINLKLTRVVLTRLSTLVSIFTGATVKLTCKNTKYKQEATAKTDKNGYFFLQAPKTVTSFGAHKCTVSLVSSPMAKCSKPSNLHGGLKGATLRPEKPFTANKLPFILYTVGPFAFEPKCY